MGIWYVAQKINGIVILLQLRKNTICVGLKKGTFGIVSSLSNLTDGSEVRSDQNFYELIRKLLNWLLPF